MSKPTNAEIMSDIERMFVCGVGVWSDTPNYFGGYDCQEFFGEVSASTPEEAIAAFPAAAGNPRVTISPVHWIGKDGVEFDFR